MPFMTRTVGGSWSGGGTAVPNCTLAERNAITVAFGDKDTRGVAGINGFAGLASLATCMTGKTIASVDIDCRGPSCVASGAFGTAPRGGNSIDMCAAALPPMGLQADCDVTVFHELVHSCGGMEVDAWSMENQFYGGHGTFNPGVATVSGFIGQTTDIGGGLRAGNFVVWERATGRAFVKVLSGGSWNSGPTVSAGAQLANVNFPPV